MKVRQGFVSNSSSCSFCVYGITGCALDVEGWFVAKNKEFAPEKIRGCGHELFHRAKFCPECGKPMWEEPDEDRDLTETITEKAHGLGLSAIYSRDSDWFCAGLAPEELGDHETGRQFKDRTKELLKQFFGDHEEKAEWVSEEVEY